MSCMHIANPHNQSQLCAQEPALKLQTIRRVVSGGDPSALIQNEVLSLGDEQRRDLLKDADISEENNWTS